MPLSVEELLTPRIKVIAPYPGSPYNVGDILIDDGKNVIMNQQGDPQFICECEKYPHLFSLMNWWEERETYEMPTYLKNGQLVLEVDYYTRDKVKFTTSCALVPFIWYKPASDKEYIEYQNSLKK